MGSDANFGQAKDARAVISGRCVVEMSHILAIEPAWLFENSSALSAREIY
jgi:hypothetical protein